MERPQRYRTLAGAGEAVHVDRKSRFIGRARPVSDESEALCFLREIREAHRDASHNCYAYRVRDNSLMRYSDDGEPGGTAGLPMMNLLLAEEITDLCLVVTRYFGGTLLGTGGLVRAYTKTAQLALQAAGIAEMTACDTALCELHYSYKERFEALLAAFGGGLLELEFGAELLYTYYTPADRSEAFEAALTELTQGVAQPVRLERSFRPLPVEGAGTGQGDPDGAAPDR
ncbi:MAG: YigZ family protein [Clostridiales bacterium]|nr:YigZ family protein [Clostridiales bacterium]